MGRRKSQDENVFILLRELTESFWQIGAAVSASFFTLAVFALRWAYLQNHIADQGIIISILVKSYGWIFYLLPLVLIVFSWAYGVYAYNAYSRQNRF